MLTIQKHCSVHRLTVTILLLNTTIIKSIAQYNPIASIYNCGSIIYSSISTAVKAIGVTISVILIAKKPLVTFTYFYMYLFFTKLIILD